MFQEPFGLLFACDTCDQRPKGSDGFMVDEVIPIVNFVTTEKVEVEAYFFAPVGFID